MKTNIFKLITYLFIISFLVSCKNDAEKKLKECLQISGLVFNGSSRVGVVEGEAVIELNEDGNYCIADAEALGHRAIQEGKLSNFELKKNISNNTYKIVADWNVDGTTSYTPKFYFEIFDEEKPNTILCQISSSDNSWSYYDNLTLSEQDFQKIKKILTINPNISISNASNEKIGSVNSPEKSTIKKSEDLTKSTISQLLLGKWKSVDDNTNYLLFDSKLRKELGGGMESWESEPYVLSDKCSNSSDIETILDGEKDRYISCNKSDMCWYIVSVDDKTLVLSFVGRGNTLTYKRVN